MPDMFGLGLLITPPIPNELFLFTVTPEATLSSYVLSIRNLFSNVLTEFETVELIFF